MDIIKKFQKVLTKKQKSRVGLLLVLVVIGAIFETLSVSMILPIVSAIVEENAFTQSKIIIAINSVLKMKTLESFVVFMLILLIFVFIFKNLYLLFMYYVQHSFIANSQYRISRDLLKVYLNKPYEFFLSANTADVLRTVYSDTTGVFSLLLQCIQFLTELIIGICLGITLLFMDFKMTIIMSILLVGITGLTNLVLKKRIRNIGEQSRQKQSLMYKSIMQSIMSIKDVKVFGKEDSFLDTYKVHGKSYYQLVRDNNVFNAIPRLVIETTCIGGVLAYLAISILLGKDVTAMLPQLTAFAVAAMRLMPCAGRLSTYLANISYYRPTLDFVYEHVEFPKVVDEREADKLTAFSTEKTFVLTKELLLENISFHYPNSEKYIFKNANMLIKAGQSVGIVGASGAGKTTIVDIMLGLLQMETGVIKCDGKNVMEDYQSWLCNIGYIPQTINLIDDTIRANVAYGYPEGSIDDKQVWSVLEEAQMKQFVEQLPEGLNTKIGERGVRLSGGQRQRLGIARALYHNPELLILDEATSALDNDTEAAIMDAINHFHGKKTMLIIAHRLKTIEDCDVIYKVEDGLIKVNGKG